MRSALTEDETTAMLVAVATHVVANTDRLTDADMAVGDGDHGIGMRRGFEGALAKLADLKPAAPDEALKSVGTAILSKTGGAAGAVFGTLFRSGAKALEDRETLDAEGFATFLETGLAAVKQRGGVIEGQKTMVDALAPAAAAARAAAATGLEAAATAAAVAAAEGVEATRAMRATTGKARSLGDRSIGHVDP
jgi:dihydroxyacetone kinase-like protein